MFWPILEARAEIQKYLRSFFGLNDNEWIQKSFWNFLTFIWLLPSRFFRIAQPKNQLHTTKYYIHCIYVKKLLYLQCKWYAYYVHHAKLKARIIKLLTNQIWTPVLVLNLSILGPEKLFNVEFNFLLKLEILHDRFWITFLESSLVRMAKMSWHPMKAYIIE